MNQTGNEGFRSSAARNAAERYREPSPFALLERQGYGSHPLCRNARIPDFGNALRNTEHLPKRSGI
jgi:hypothetical protein